MTFRVLHVRHAVLWSVIIALASVACNGPAVPGAAPPVGDFECGGPDYPCDPADVSADVIERSSALMAAALERLESGSTYEAIAAWLRSQPDVAEAQSSVHALRFRVTGGRAHWLSDLLIGDVEADTVAAALEANPPAGRAQTVAVRPPKHALVLSPLFAEYELLMQAERLPPMNLELYDPGHRVAARLRQGVTPFWDSTAGSDTVEHLVNTLAEQQITVDAFRTFTQYDLVYIAGHAGTVCEPKPDGEGTVCRSVMTIGDQLPPDTACETVADGRFLDCFMITVRNDAGEVTSRFLTRAVTSDFLEHHYPQGFSNMIMWFGGCSLFRYVPDGQPGVEHRFVDLLRRGTNSVYFGWTDLIGAISDGDAARAVLGTLITTGVRTGEVFHDVSMSIHDYVNKEGRTAELVRFGTYIAPERSNRDRQHGFVQPLAGREPRGAHGAEIGASVRPDLRIREIVTLVDASGWPLFDGDALTPYVDGVAGDGVPDRLDLHVQVDGVLPGELDDFVLRFELNGTPIGQGVPLSQASPVPFDEPFSVLAHVTGLQTGVDLVANASYTLEAIVDLPEGGTSHHVVNLGTGLCFAETTISGAYAAEVQGPAQFSFDATRGRLNLRLYDWEHLRYRDGLQAQGGFSIAAVVTGLGSTLVPGSFDLEELEIIYHPDELMGAIEWSARQSAREDCMSAPCPGCEPVPCGSGRITITGASDRHLSGRVEAVAFGVEPYDDWPPPYWEVGFDASFDAVTGASPMVDPGGDFAMCVAAGL